MISDNYPSDFWQNNEKGFWYCLACKEEIDGGSVTYDEMHDYDCAGKVIWVTMEFCIKLLKLFKIR